MNMSDTTVQKGRKRGRNWSPEQKMALLQEWRDGTPLEEICRREGLASWSLYRWRKGLERGLAQKGELVPKPQLVAAWRRVDELEKALGRKTLENEILKKAFELKGLRMPEGS